MEKILIANRGEIASRIIRTCRELGIRTIAVHSEADAGLPFVKEADESFEIGPGPVPQSYLKGDEIIDLAKREGADAIHPGYGLLSENASFARKVQEAGLAFIGPSADVIEKMGDKIEARRAMIKAGVPVVPGTEEGVATLEEAIRAAGDIGYPVMMKASAGGGGIGMVRCESEQALSRNFEGVKKRAMSYFGDDRVFIEKFIDEARHIEVQIFGDSHGNVVHLFERNCSVQRRNQKVIEESPSPGFPEEAKERMLQAAVEAGKAVGYTNAGTVEFIVGPDHEFYFLEMNTRLQVEHPVTEAVTGFDLVEWQIRVASGEELPVKVQDSITSSGHAIEYRIYAEDPEKFLPSPGKITQLALPEGEGVRIDRGYTEGDTVTPFYDPMIAKVIISGSSREEAIRRSEQFFGEAHAAGVRTNIPLFASFAGSEEFAEGNYTTQVLAGWQAKKKEEV
ncbi:Acetyl-/propionyl-coenzyme A carboxylase alpha chain [Bhargavaea cecembensis DSE10]|uniref:biotin carboxylase n=1 Tax=Bhargavaea cecembensis DSE10 TaxID=1235279 RepID=M7NGC6_9BACL|nr:acetyl-CoA carboxylase biotin carboxylase subunit [Bhargavaea cecembensis]EMR07613.1 Acetyl-/propionyl-coenzyme A carboxylase alpha chain [Bhargavaea cecembensis DSE10]